MTADDRLTATPLITGIGLVSCLGEGDRRRIWRR